MAIRGLLISGVLVVTFFQVRSSALDSTVISKINSNAYRQFLSQPDSAIALANRAISLAEKNNYPFQAAFGYFVLSKANWTKVNFFPASFMVLRR